MKNKIFSKGLYVESLRQLRVAGIIALVLFFLVAVGGPIIDLFSYYNNTGAPQIVNSSYGYDSYYPTIVDYVDMMSMLPSLMIWGPIFGIVLFGQFNRRVASDFYHSLPYTRLCTYISFTAGLLTWLGIIFATYTGASIIAHVAMPSIYIVSFAGMFDFMLTVIAATLLLTFGLICAMSFTGTILSNLISAGLIIYGPRLAIIMITGIIEDLAPVLTTANGFLAPQFNVVMGITSYISDSYTGNIENDIYTIIISFVYLAIGAYLFTRRKSETAGQTAGNKYVQDGIRIALAFAISAAGTGTFMISGDILSLIFACVFAAIAYFGFELITKKSFKSLARTIPGVGIVAVLNLLLVGVCLGGVALIHSYTPDANDIKGFYIMADEDSSHWHEVGFATYAEGFTEDILIDDEKAKEIICESLKESVEESKEGRFNMQKFDPYGKKIKYTKNRIKIVSNSGIERQRCIWIKTEDNISLAEAVKKLDGYRDIYMNLPEALERSISVYAKTISGDVLAPEKYSEIYECLRNEVKELDFAEWYDRQKNFGMTTEDATMMKLNLTTKKDGTIISIPVFRDITPKTHFAIIEAFSHDAKGEIKLLKQRYDEILNDESEGQHKFLTISIEGVTEDGTKGWSYYDDVSKGMDGYSYVSESNYTLTKHILEELEKAAADGKKPESGEFVTVYARYEEYTDEYEYCASARDFQFIIAHPDKLDIPEEYCYYRNE